MAYTHFIEQFKNKDKLMNGVLCEIKDLQRNLKITASSPDLKTIAVWKIKFKDSYITNNLTTKTDTGTIPA